MPLWPAGQARDCRSRKEGPIPFGGANKKEYLMNKEMTLYYKSLLAHDFIKFLLDFQLIDMSPEQKVAQVNMILDEWETRVDRDIKKVLDINIKDVAEKEGLDADIVYIIANIHQIAPGITRKEFKREVKENALSHVIKQT